MLYLKGKVVKVIQLKSGRKLVNVLIEDREGQDIVKVLCSNGYKKGDQVEIALRLPRQDMFFAME